MALIPQNLERLNYTAPEYPGVSFFFFSEYIEKEVVFDDWNSDRISYPLSEHQLFDQFLLASHCLRKIPEFQENKILGFPNTIAGGTLHGIAYNEEERLVIWDTPPSTLNQLCESYKNIMSED
jgi:hypothetical protein